MVPQPLPRRGRMSMGVVAVTLLAFAGGVALTVAGSLLAGLSSVSITLLTYNASLGLIFSGFTAAARSMTGEREVRTPRAEVLKLLATIRADVRTVGVVTMLLVVSFMFNPFSTNEGKLFLLRSAIPLSLASSLFFTIGAYVAFATRFKKSAKVFGAVGMLWLVFFYSLNWLVTWFTIDPHRPSWESEALLKSLGIQLLLVAFTHVFTRRSTEGRVSPIASEVTD